MHLILAFGSGDGPQIPGAFVAFFLLAVLVGIGSTVWRITTAREIARSAGLDPDQATAVTLLGSDGLAATYVAGAVGSRAVHKSAQERLTELAQLHEQGLITEAEYDERRQAIIDQV